MSDRDSDLRAQIKHTEVALNRFEKQAVIILVSALTLAVMTDSLL
jgi:hypothetical protein